MRTVFLFAFLAATSLAAADRALTGATLIDGRGGAAVPNANVLVRDGKIACAGTATDCPVPKGVAVLNLRGTWITPGLVDAHVHFSQTGWADGRPDGFDYRDEYPYEKTIAMLEASPQRFGHSYLCSGVTAVFDVGGYPWTLRLAERFAGDTTLPHVAAAGPLLSTRDHWLNLPAERQFIHLKDEQTALTGVRYLAARGAKAVKVWFIVDSSLPAETSAPWVAAAGGEARAQGLPLIVHATGVAEAKAAIRAGAKLLVHLVWDDAVDDEFLDLARSSGVIITPTLTVSSGYTRLARAIAEKKAPAVDDANRCIDPLTRAHLAETATLETTVTAEQLARREQRNAERDRLRSANFKRILAAGIPIATGTDAGNPLTLHGVSIYAEMEAMQRDGMAPMQVIVASTATAARAAGLQAVTGTVEKGKSADLLVLEADPSADIANVRKLRHVMRAGVLRSVKELSAVAQRDN